MSYFLYGLFFLSCVVLIASVLLQPGKTDAGALFTSNVSSAAFGPRGTATILSKITIGAATTFMLTALLLAMPALNGKVSVLQTTSESQTETTQPPITDLSINSNANANVPPATNLAVESPNTNAAVNAPVSANTATNTNVKANINAKANTKAATNANAPKTAKK
ncbi:MAG TPA: preprotein translocase subunit SecG [Pyrinomonadaceae bacterium]|jgi:preprotein translocase subunit SecG